MNSQLPLVAKVRKPTLEVKEPKLFILIHGYGSNEEDLFSFDRDLPDEAYVVSLRAPHSMGVSSYYWYQINMQGGKKLYDNQEAMLSLELIKNSIDLLKKYLQISSKNIFMIGFSQGSILSYALTTKYPEKVQNIVALSGYWDDALVGEIDKSKDISQLNFFISHGKLDPVIPFALSEIAPNRLKELKVPYIYKSYASGHTINRENYVDMLNWINEKKR